MARHVIEHQRVTRLGAAAWSRASCSRIPLWPPRASPLSGPKKCCLRASFTLFRVRKGDQHCLRRHRYTAHCCDPSCKPPAILPLTGRQTHKPAIQPVTTVSALTPVCATCNVSHQMHESHRSRALDALFDDFGMGSSRTSGPQLPPRGQAPLRTRTRPLRRVPNIAPGMFQHPRP
jgi:hypothetical protein